MKCVNVKAMQHSVTVYNNTLNVKYMQTLFAKNTNGTSQIRLNCTVYYVVFCFMYVL